MSNENHPNYPQETFLHHLEESLINGNSSHVKEKFQKMSFKTQITFILQLSDNNNLELLRRYTH